MRLTTLDRRVQHRAPWEFGLRRNLFWRAPALLQVTFALSQTLLGCAALASEPRFELSGKLLGADGQPLRAGFVRPVVGGGKLHHVGPDGRFSIALKPSPGMFAWFGGVNHETILVPVLVRGPRLELLVHLVTPRLPRILSPLVVGKFNSFGSVGGIAMRPDTNGTWSATVPCDADTFAYQILLLDPEVRLIPLPAERLMLDRRIPLVAGMTANYVAILAPPPQPCSVRFDPTALPDAGDPGTVHLVDGDPDAAALIEIDLAFQRTRATCLEQPRADEPGAVDTTCTNRLRRLVHEPNDRNELRRGFRVLSYFRAQAMDGDSLLAREALRIIPSSSPLWSLEWAGPLNTFRKIAQLSKTPDDAFAYAKLSAETHPDTTVRASFLYYQWLVFRKKADQASSEIVLQRLLRDYPRSSEAERARRQASTSTASLTDLFRALEFVDADDSSRVFRLTDYRGNYVLVDFWAVSCGPCIAEMPHLHQAFKRFNGQGLQLVSVSLDRTRETVHQFRRKRWPMPWEHYRLASGFADKACRTIGLASIPHPFLIDPNGVIVAEGADLRGKALVRTLASRLPHATSAK